MGSGGFILGGLLSGLGEGLQQVGASQAQARRDAALAALKAQADAQNYALKRRDELADRDYNAAREDAKPITVSPGATLTDRTGKVLYAAPDNDPRKGWVQVQNADGSSSWKQLPGAAGAGTAAGDTIASGGNGAAPYSGNAPRNVRNNNPGNIVDGKFAKSQPGYKGSDGRFAIFDSPDAGGAAQAALLSNYGKMGLNTVQAVINRWAPPSDGNDTSAYVKTVAKALGVAPDQKIDMRDPATIAKLQSIISRVEGTPSNPSNGAPAPTRMASSSGSIDGDRTPKPAAGQQPPSGYRWAPDGSLQAIPGGPADKGKTGGNKAIPDSTAKRVQAQVNSYDSLTRAQQTFNDGFGGNTVTGGLEGKVQGLFGDGALGTTPGARQWWADFAATDNQIRNSLFGASLTDSEKKAYEATTIAPSMAPDVIRENLNRRAAIVASGLARQAKFLKTNGYNPDAVDALTQPDPLSSQAGGQASAPARVVAPAAPPPGATQVGTSKGRPVYKLPSGKLVVIQ